MIADIKRAKLRNRNPEKLMAYKFLTTALALGAFAAGCSPMQTPINDEPVATGASYQAQLRTVDHARDERNAHSSTALNEARCASDMAVSDAGSAKAPSAFSHEHLSPGDLLSIAVGEDEVFTGDFEVSRDGNLKAPYLKAIPTKGRSAGDLGDDLRDRLVAEGYYPAPGPRVSVRIKEFAPVRIAISGAVFEPREAVIGEVSDERDLVRQAAVGGNTEGRNLSAALRAAGGVRPDADLAQVRIIRDDVEHVLDLRRAMVGRKFPDVMLLAGDEVIVPSRGCFQEALMTPTSITAPGVKVFMSNLTKPADANALSAVGKEARELRYGTRFLQAVVGMNCVGGAKLTNADRSAVLFTRNPVTGASIVIERRIEDLLRGERRDDLDPFIMPGDALACYDSAVTDLTELARSLGIAGAGIALAL